MPALLSVPGHRTPQRRQKSHVFAFSTAGFTCLPEHLPQGAVHSFVRLKAPGFVMRPLRFAPRGTGYELGTGVPNGRQTGHLMRLEFKRQRQGRFGAGVAEQGFPEPVRWQARRGPRRGERCRGPETRRSTSRSLPIPGCRRL